MLLDLGTPKGRRWDLAEPYVLRHALDHAIAAYSADTSSAALSALLLDPEFLVHVDPSVSAILERLRTATLLRPRVFLPRRHPGKVLERTRLRQRSQLR